MPSKKFVVTKVTVKKDSSVATYLKTGNGDDLKDLLKGVAKMGNWSVTPKGEEISAASPTVDKHPGHVHGKDWKLNIEKGNGSKDRLVLCKRAYTVLPNKSKPDQLNVEISCSAYVLVDTH